MASELTAAAGRWAGIAVIAIVATLLPQAPAPVAAAEPAASAASAWVDVSAGDNHNCAIRADGLIACWGLNQWGQATPPTGTYRAVSVGVGNSCAIKTDGTLACWGHNYYGQSTPPAGEFTAVSVGDFHACAIAGGGTMACWGDDTYGQATPPSGTFATVSAGGNHTCAIRDDQTLACWGANFGGQATPPAGKFKAVSAGLVHTCGLSSDGNLACWGAATAPDGRSNPPAGPFAAVAAGGYHTCGIRTDGTLACWGADWNGQAVPPAGSFATLSAGGWHNCATKTDGTLACWGEDGWGKTSTRPTAAIAAQPLFVATASVALGWNATPGIAPVTSFDVRVRRAPWNGGFGSTSDWLSGTTANTATFNGSPGSTYCFSVLARDAVDMLSAWTTETCTAIPLDDRSLARAGNWVAGTGSPYYRSTYSRSSSYGARLTRTGVVAKRIALLATTCRTCGTVKVYWGSTLLKTVSLYSATTVNRKVIPIKTFTTARSGTLKIKVVSSAKKVIIDGVAVRRN